MHVFPGDGLPSIAPIDDDSMSDASDMNPPSGAAAAVATTDRRTKLMFDELKQLSSDFPEDEDDMDLADGTAGPSGDPEPMEEDSGPVKKIIALIKQRRKENGFDPERTQKTGGMVAHTSSR